jgi:hypothetical protein
LNNRIYYSVNKETPEEKKNDKYQNKIIWAINEITLSNKNRGGNKKLLQ